MSTEYKVYVTSAPYIVQVNTTATQSVVIGGVPGIQGLQGVQGIQGIQGPSGSQGPVGPAADTSSFLLISQTSSMSVLSASYAPMPDVSVYVLTSSTGSMSVATASFVTWSNVSGKPTAVSSFTNDSEYVTSAQTASMAVLTAATASFITWANVNGKPTAVSSFTNDSAYVTSTQTGSMSVATASYVTTAQTASFVAWSNVDGRPTAVSTFTNDSAYVTSAQTGSMTVATASWVTTAQTASYYNTSSLARKDAANTFTSGQTISGSIVAVSSAFPVGNMIRTSATTNAIRSTFAAKHLTSGDMVDGFGADVSFLIQDSSGVENEIANFGAFRDGGDSTGALGFYTRVGGVKVERMRIASGGTVVVSGSQVVTGSMTAGQLLVTASLNTAPVSVSSSGSPGDIRFATDGIYLCTATNTWAKAALGAF